MKKIIIIGLFVFVLLRVFSQTPVPNYSFEEWSVVNNHEVPNYWYIRQVYNPEDKVDYGYSITTDKYDGSYALKLFNSISTGDTIYGMIHTLPPNHQEEIQPSFPVLLRHTTLKGYYKYIPDQGDSCQFLIWMYMHEYSNKLTNNILGGGSATKGGSETYVPFSIDISYYDNGDNTPDSACISLSAFKMYNFTNMQKTKPQGNSELYVDNISFDSFITGINTLRNSIKKISIFPNPTSSILNINLLVEESNYQINLFDLQGRLIKPIINKLISGNQQISVDLEGIPAGEYLLMISNNKGYSCNKVVVK